MPANLPPRRLIVLAGSSDWGNQTADELLQASGLPANRVYRADTNSAGLLGQERATVIVDTWTGLDPDALGRVSGLVEAGGALLLICPPLSEWPDYPDPIIQKLTPYASDAPPRPSCYLKRWTDILKSLTGIEYYREGQTAAIPPISPQSPVSPPDRACTPDQQQAVAAIIRTARGRPRRPTLLRADRGRGKSAALGLAAGQLIADGQNRHIIVTAGGFNQVANLFKHARAVLPDATLTDNGKTLLHPGGSLRYLAADLLIDTPREASLLIVDEAASLGVARLEALLGHYPRIVFSGTERGYEGSGRGFSIKFRQLLETHSTEVCNIKLDIPIRWASDDPLERWINRLLLLDLDNAALALPASLDPEQLDFAPLEQASLASDEGLLCEVFSLLIDAHYQTRPIDCRHLLDAPNSRLYAARCNNRIVGLIWAMDEGGLQENIAVEIAAGRRRPQGHLIPQVLAAHLGLEQAVTLRCQRIQRIVVAPSVQRRGIGNWMLRQLVAQPTCRADYLASSFGVNRELARFWQRAGFSIVRVGDRRRATSGLHSAVALRPRNPATQKLADQAREIFAAQLVAQLAFSLNQLAPQLVAQFAPVAPSAPSLGTYELKSAALFAWGKMPFESSLAVLGTLAKTALFDPQLKLERASRELLIARLLQHRSWAECADTQGLAGREACIERLREGVGQILNDRYRGEKMTALRSRFGLQG